MTFVLPDLRELEYPQFGPEGGLVGAWSPALSGATGSTLYDLSGRRNHGTLTNMDPATDWVVSGGRSALDFDGSNDHCPTTMPASLLAGNASLVAWVTTQSTATAYVVSNYDSGGSADTFCIGVQTGFRVVWNNSTIILDATAITLGKVYFIAATRSGVAGSWTATLTVDATTTSATTAVDPVAGATNYTIGRTGDYAPALYWNGSVLDVLAYTRALSKSEISTLYSLGPGGWSIPRQRRWNALGAAAASFQAAWAANINRVITPGTV